MRRRRYSRNRWKWRGRCFPLQPQAALGLPLEWLWTREGWFIRIVSTPSSKARALLRSPGEARLATTETRYRRAGREASVQERRNETAETVVAASPSPAAYRLPRRLPEQEGLQVRCQTLAGIASPVSGKGTLRLKIRQMHLHWTNRVRGEPPLSGKPPLLGSQVFFRQERRVATFSGQPSAAAEPRAPAAARIALAANKALPAVLRAPTAELRAPPNAELRLRRRLPSRRASGPRPLPSGLRHRRPCILMKAHFPLAMALVESRAARYQAAV